MQTLDNFNFAGKKAFVRVDFNVPLDENLNITDDTRMRAALPTLKKILADGGSIIIGSHLGRPKKGPEDKFSLKHIVNHLSELLGQPVKFVNDCQGDAVKAAVAELKPGEVLVLENLRFYAEEEGKPRGLADDASDEEKAAAKKAVKESQKEFTKHLAELADVYVNDAFGSPCTRLYRPYRRLLLSGEQNVRVLDAKRGGIGRKSNEKSRTPRNSHHRRFESFFQNHDYRKPAEQSR